MTETQCILWASLLLGLQYLAGSAALANPSVSSHMSQQHLSSQPTKTQSLPVRRMSPAQSLTVSSNRQNVAAPLLDSQYKGISLQIPSTTPGDKARQFNGTSHATELSASEQRLLQHLGWTLGRRGLEALKALVDKGPAPASSGANSHQALKTFWKHVFGLSWLYYRQEEEDQMVHGKGAQQAQHKATLATQQAQHANFELAQQALQQAAQQAQHKTAYLQSVHGDVLNPMSSKQELLEQDGMPSVGQLVTKDAHSDELVHFNLVKQPATEGFPRPVLVSSQGGQGTVQQDTAVVTISKEGAKTSNWPRPEKMGQDNADYIEGPVDQQLPMDDDFLTPWDELPTDMEKAASITHPEQRHSRQQVQEQLPTLSYMKGLGDQPQVALAQAKQQFTQWLSGAHAHPDYSEHIEQQKAQHRQAVTGFVYTEDSNGIKYKVAADEAGQLKHASLGV